MTYVTGKELTKICKVSMRAIRGWANKGKIKHFRLPNNGKRMYDLTSFQSLLESKTLQDSTLFMPEYQVKNKNLILTDKLKNYKRAIQNTNYLKTLEAVSTAKFLNFL